MNLCLSDMMRQSKKAGTVIVVFLVCLVYSIYLVT